MLQMKILRMPLRNLIFKHLEPASHHSIKMFKSVSILTSFWQLFTGLGTISSWSSWKKNQFSKDLLRNQRYCLFFQSFTSIRSLQEYTWYLAIDFETCGLARKVFSFWVTLLRFLLLLKFLATNSWQLLFLESLWGPLWCGGRKRPTNFCQGTRVKSQYILGQ